VSTVLVTDYTWASLEPEIEVLARVGARTIVASDPGENELVRLVRDADAILTCFADVTRAVIRAGERLQVISRYGIGTDNIDVDEATRQGIVVTNVPDYCIEEVTEHALALLLALARGVCVFNGGVRNGNWELLQAGHLRRVAGQTLGIVGYGRIGRRLAEKAAGLGLTVIAYDPLAEDAEASHRGIRLVGLDDLAQNADFVSLHAPLTPTTQGIIGERFLQAMKPTAVLINTARGGLVDHDALARALSNGWIAGAGIDVFEPERLPRDHPLLGLDNLVATPHVAFYSELSVLELELAAARNVADVLAGRRPGTVINPEVFELPRWQHLA
jgi:D-3-phosphoglycerate dehydrogenase